MGIFKRPFSERNFWMPRRDGIENFEIRFIKSISNFKKKNFQQQNFWTLLKRNHLCIYHLKSHI